MKPFKTFITLLAGTLLLAGCTSAPNAIASSSSSSTTSSSALSACEGEGFGCPVDTKEEQSDAKAEAYKKDVADFTPISFEDAIAFFEEGKSGVLYFGFPACPWCDELVPILKEEAEKNDIEVLYVQTRDDQKERLYTDEQRDRIEPYLPDYIRNNLKGELTLYVPLVVSVVDGKVADGHQGTTEDHDAKEREMTDEEKAELKDALQKLIESHNASQS